MVKRPYNIVPVILLLEKMFDLAKYLLIVLFVLRLFKSSKATTIKFNSTTTIIPATNYYNNSMAKTGGF